MRQVTTILLCIIGFSSNTFSQTNYSSILTGTSKSREICEWSLAVSLAGLNAFYLVDLEPFPSTPLLKTKYKSHHRQETVPDGWIYGTGFILNTAIILLPNKKGRMNYISYRHSKGFVESCGVYTPLLTTFAKLITGKKRPCFDEKIHAKDPDARKSFCSGHASSSFAVTTYFNLYLYHHIGKNTASNLMWKIPASILLFGAAAYVVKSRVDDHVHDALDVTTGAFVGTCVSIIIFGVHENWFG